MDEKQLEERLRPIEEDIDRLREPRKDIWDKLQIFLSILIPFSIAFAGFMVSKSLKDAEIQSALKIAEGDQKVAKTIAKGNLEVARTNAEVAKAKLIHDFLEPLTDTTQESKNKRLLALKAVAMALQKPGQQLVEMVKEMEPEQSEIQDVAREILDRKLNGEECTDSKECLSGYCYPGPIEDSNYCLAAHLNCAFPGGEGYYYGNVVPFDDKEYQCYRPSSGKAQWREE